MSLSELTRDQKLAKIELLEEKKRRLSRRKIWTYYPETGALRRELYAQHMEFFRLGKEHSTRCFMAANRVGKCCTAKTLIDTPNGEIMIKDLRSGDFVFSWDGKTKIAKPIIEPFKKIGLHECVRVVMSDGRWFEAADNHRVLTLEGWRFLSDCLPEFFSSHHPSNLGFVQSAHALSDPHWSQKLAGFLYRYFASHHRCDERLHSSIGVGQSHFQQQDGALIHSPASLNLDDLENKSLNNPLQFSCLPSNSGVLRQIAVRFSEFLALAACKNAEPNLLKLPISLLLRGAAGAALRLVGGAASLKLPFVKKKIAPCKFQLVDGTCIMAVIPIGCQEVYDFTVPDLNNYCAAGVVHHNTEGGGGYEVVMHLTGLYPDWWEGRRFDHPTDCWAAGDTNETVRDIIQLKMIGAKDNEGTGLIPGDLLVDVKYRQGSNGSADYVTVKHVSGGVSRLGLKSYEQGRVSFQGTEKHVVWLDEESNEGIRTECVMRLMTTGGLLIETFTPLKGLTPIVLGYIGDDGIGETRTRINGDKAFIMAGWDDVPHLSKEVKDRMLAECEPHLRDARSKGIPSLGSGAIYPVAESDISIDDFEIPVHWPRGYALDVGWNRTAAVWGAKDPETGVIYLYSEHYVGQAEPVIHATAIKSRGDWMRGSIDPAARGRGQKDGEQLLQNYIDLGLSLELANNGVESGIYSMWERLSTGKLKVFNSLRNWLSEYRIYRRDERGHIVKKNDHLMDATRYLVATGDEYFGVRPAINNKIVYPKMNRA